jgi:glycosyltransferase involved in cell wall biosynthesis
VNTEGKVPVTCVILTLNEEANIPVVLASLGPAEQVVVVDSGSTDQTVALATALDAEVFENAWPGYASQRNWAIEHAALRHPWVLFIDADEQMSPEGWAEIKAFLSDPGDRQAADFRRSVHLFGRELKHGGFNTARVTRLLHRGHCRFLERPVHEHAIVNGPIHHLTVPIIHDDRKSFAAWLDRHNRYSSLEAEARLHPAANAPAGSARLKHQVRTFLWPRLPARPLLFFLYVYVVRLGFLDGKAGLRIAAFYGFQELSVQVKLDELRKGYRC